uniref:Peroxygenase 5 n=1 Tax=Glycine max TaxID=3847 RepID=K7LDH0_SOYBN
MVSSTHGRLLKGCVKSGLGFCCPLEVLFSSMCFSVRGKFPSILFPIEIKNIQRGKHGSDTGVYDTEGRFVPSKFEEIFNKHAHTHPNALTYDELTEMIKANREPKDFSGRIGSVVEWKILYKLAKDKSGLLQKETIRGVYDGSLFEQLKKQHSSGKEK